MRKQKRTSYIPETHDNDSSNDGLSRNGEELDDSETSPLLDISKEIEQCSEDWPIDPDGNSVTLTDDVSHFNGFKLAHPFGRPKRFLLEVFIMVNMAQLMYTAMLVFAKSAMLAHGASISNLFLYRCAVLFFIQSIKQAVFPDHDELSMSGKNWPQHRQYDSSMYNAWL